jgi:hypothetical protein
LDSAEVVDWDLGAVLDRGLVAVAVVAAAVAEVEDSDLESGLGWVVAVGAALVVAPDAG